MEHNKQMILGTEKGHISGTVLLHVGKKVQDHNCRLNSSSMDFG